MEHKNVEQLHEPNVWLEMAYGLIQYEFLCSALNEWKWTFQLFPKRESWSDDDKWEKNMRKEKFIVFYICWILVLTIKCGNNNYFSAFFDFCVATCLGWNGRLRLWKTSGIHI